MGSVSALSRVQSAAASAVAADVVRHDDSRLTGGSAVAPPGPSPASILNIGTRLGQSHFSAQLARLGDSSPFTRSTVEIAAGFEESPIFVSTADRAWVQTRVQVGAPVIGSSVSSRAELREQGENGLDYGFDAKDSGTHYAQGRFRIVKAPAVLPDIVVAQLHNGSSDRVAIRTQLVSGTWRLRIRINGSTATLDLGGTDIATGISNIQGLDWDWRIEVINGTVKVFVGLADDPNTLVTAKVTSTALVSTGSASWYFKTGTYLQTSTNDGDTASDYGEVWLRNLVHWHTGWAAVAPFYAVAKHAATHAAGAYDAISPVSIGAAPLFNTQRVVTANTTLTDSDWTLIVNSASSVTVSYPTAVGRAGRRFTVVKAGTGPLILDPAGSETINGALTESLSMQWGFREVESDGANWIVVGGKVDPVIANLADTGAGGTLTINAVAASVYRGRLTGSTATLAVPTNPVDGDVINIELYATVACVLTFASGILETGGIPGSVSIGAGKLWSGAMRYRAATSPATSAAAWRILASSIDN